MLKLFWRESMQSLKSYMEEKPVTSRRVSEDTIVQEIEDATETLVRWDLKEKDGVTTVRVTHSGSDEREPAQANDGWPMILGLLQAHSEITS
jgi:hypothetical protein